MTGEQPQPNNPYADFMAGAAIVALVVGILAMVLGSATDDGGIGRVLGIFLLVIAALLGFAWLVVKAARGGR